jgi:hypothetical protein
MLSDRQAAYAQGQMQAKTDIFEEILVSVPVHLASDDKPGCRHDILVFDFFSITCFL